MPEDRPNEEQWKDDERFDGWLIAFERKILNKNAPMHRVANSNADNQI